MKIFLVEIFFWSNFFCLEKNLFEIYFGRKKFGSKKCLGEQKLGSNKILAKKIFASKLFLANKNLGQNFCLTEEKNWSKKMLSEFFWGQTFFGMNSSWVALRLHTENHLSSYSGSGLQICTDWFYWFLVFWFWSKPIIQPTQICFSFSLAGVWQ